MLKMKKFFDKFSNSGLLMIAVMLLCSVFGVGGAGVLTANTVTPDGGGAVTVGEGATVSNTQDVSGNLMLDTIDDKVVKIRPYDAILDTIARQAKDVKTVNSQVVRHYAIDVLDVSAKVATAYTANAETQIALNTDNNDLFANDQTILVKGVAGYEEDGVTTDGNDLMLYVVGKDANNKLLVKAVNGVKSGTTLNTIPSIAENTELLRMGRAGSELQIQSDAHSGVPTDLPVFLQKFMIQIEESTLHKIRDKEVDWTFTDQEEEAVFEMRQTQNNSFWFGVRRLLKTKNSRSQNKVEDVYFTGGIWNQAGKEFDFDSADGVITAGDIVSLMKHSFTGNSSGKRKIFLCGSDLLEAIEKVEYTKTVYLGGKAEAQGVVYNEIVSKFGTLLLAHDQSLDRAGKANSGFVLDPDLIRKYTIGWKTHTFDFKKSGEKDADGRSLIEICALALKNPKAHSKVFLNKA